MTESPLISVIIPVYNSGKYLRRCLQSLREQTFDNWEAICVNDGSTDSSAEILDEYGLADSRIRVFHTVNRGVSEARNFGMGQVKGKYVGFIDSDDFIHPQTFEICNLMISKENPDLIAYTYNRTYRLLTGLKNILKIPTTDTPNFPLFNLSEICSLSTKDIFDYVTEYSHPKVDRKKKRWMVKHCQPWRGLYRKECVERISFIPGIIYEDFPWWGEVLLNIRKAVILNLPLYYYYPNPRSYILSTPDARKTESLKKAIDRAERIYENRATGKQKNIWINNFLIPFKKKLASKEKKLKRSGAS